MKIRLLHQMLKNSRLYTKGIIVSPLSKEGKRLHGHSVAFSIGPNKLLFLYRASNRTVIMSPLFHSNRQMILLGFTTIYKTMFNDLTIYRLPLAAEARLPAQVQDPAVAAGVPAGPAGAGLRQQLQPLPQQPPRQRRASGTHAFLDTFMQEMI